MRTADGGLLEARWPVYYAFATMAVLSLPRSEFHVPKATVEQLYCYCFELARVERWVDIRFQNFEVLCNILTKHLVAVGTTVSLAVFDTGFDVFSSFKNVVTESTPSESEK